MEAAGIGPAFPLDVSYLTSWSVTKAKPICSDGLREGSKIAKFTKRCRMRGCGSERDRPTKRYFQNRQRGLQCVALSAAKVRCRVPESGISASERSSPKTFLLESRTHAIRYNIEDSNKGLRREAVGC